MKKYGLTIILAVITGLFLSKLFFSQYKDAKDLKTVFNNGETLYFARQGIYSSLDSVKENTMNLSYYIYTMVDDKYYVYYGITKDLENYDKIAGNLKSLGYDNYREEINVSSTSFIETLEQYDMLLKETSDNTIIKAICAQVLASYEELVLNGSED